MENYEVGTPPYNKLVNVIPGFSRSYCSLRFVSWVWHERPNIICESLFMTAGLVVGCKTLCTKSIFINIAWLFIIQFPSITVEPKFPDRRVSGL